MKSFLINRRVLITGANGFIGGHLGASLNDHGALISVIDRSSSCPQYFQRFIGDLRDAAFVARSVKQCDPEIIFHLAAFKERASDIESFSQAISVNLVGSLNLFTAAVSLTSLRSIVVVGTAEEYGRIPIPFHESSRERPVNAYSFSKLCVTHLCEVLNSIYGIPFVIVRPTLAYGPGQGMDMFLPALITSLINNLPFPMTPGRQTRDYLYVTDLVDALLLAALSQEAQGQVINIGSGQSLPIADIALKIEQSIGKSGLVRIGAKEYRRGEIMEYVVDSLKARALLQWSPKVSLEEGLHHTIAYYQRVHS